jgi:hypothetical protein
MEKKRKGKKREKEKSKQKVRRFYANEPFQGTAANMTQEQRDLVLGGEARYGRCIESEKKTQGVKKKE